MPNGLVSVILPSFNRAGTILAAAQSVLDQSYRELELIIVDDGSSDETQQRLSELHDSRLRVLYQQNQGACVARNRGIAEANGDFIAFHDSDDLWRREKLRHQMAVFQARPETDLVFCKLQGHAGERETMAYPRHIQGGPVRLEDDLFGIGTQTILARRIVLEQERFDPEMPRYQDLEWLFRVLMRFQVYCLDEPLVDYYIGADSISRDPEKLYKALSLFFTRYGSCQQRCAPLFLHAGKNLLEGALEAERRGQAPGKYLRLAWKMYPGIGSFLRAKKAAKGR